MHVYRRRILNAGHLEGIKVVRNDTPVANDQATFEEVRQLVDHRPLRLRDCLTGIEHVPAIDDDCDLLDIQLPAPADRNVGTSRHRATDAAEPCPGSSRG